VRVEIVDEDREARIRTVTGWLHPFAPRPGELSIRSIARGLATEVRYAGQTRRPYCVAEHSVIVSLYVAPPHARQALLHDGSEAFLGDVPAPIKHAPCMRGFVAVEEHVQGLIFGEFGVAVTERSEADVHEVDQRVCSDEMPRLLTVPPGFEEEHRAHMRWSRTRYGRPLGARTPCLPWRQAEYLYLRRFAELFPERAGEAGALHAEQPLTDETEKLAR
jgi:hypothetical protein